MNNLQLNLRSHKAGMNLLALKPYILLDSKNLSGITLDSSGGVTTVANWISYNGIRFLQPQKIDQPKYTANGILFDNPVSGRIGLNQEVLAVPQDKPHEVFIVVSSPNNNNGYWVGGMVDFPADNFQYERSFMVYSAKTARLSTMYTYTDGKYTPVAWTTPALNLNLAETNLYSMQFDRTSKFAFNSPIYTHSNTPQDSNIQRGLFRGYRLGVSCYGWAGGNFILYEFIAFDRLLTQPERNYVVTYLKSKWRLYVAN